MTSYTAKWNNDENIASLSSVYQTQSGLDSAVSSLSYAKNSDVSNALSTSGFQTSTDVSNAITALALDSTYQTQSGLDSAVGGLNYQKDYQVGNSITAALNSNPTGFQYASSLDTAVSGLGYVKVAGADATKASNVYSSLSTFFNVLSSAASIKDSSGNPYDFTSLINALNA